MALGRFGFVVKNLIDNAIAKLVVKKLFSIPVEPDGIVNIFLKRTLSGQILDIGVEMIEELKACQ